MVRLLVTSLLCHMILMVIYCEKILFNFRLKNAEIVSSAFYGAIFYLFLKLSSETVLFSFRFRRSDYPVTHSC